MYSKQKIKCEECGKKTSNIHGPMLNLCRRCFSKNKFETRIPNGPMIFEEPLDMRMQLKGSITLTKSQSDKIRKRLDYLFPDRKQRYKFSESLRYIKMLILNDISQSD